MVHKRQMVITELTTHSCTLQATGNQTDSICKISFGRGLESNPATMIHGSPFLGQRIISANDCIISLTTPPTHTLSLLPTKPTKWKMSNTLNSEGRERRINVDYQCWCVQISGKNFGGRSRESHLPVAVVSAAMH